ncbi:MAG: LysM peptidoglycan-binding domain-containing protein, partial [Pirellulales bacterium]
SPTLRGGDVADAAPQPEASPRRWYLGEEGDTLYDIARFELGQSARWTEIVEMNRATVGDSFSKLRPGTRLLLPSNATSHPVATRPNRDARRY